MAGKITLSHRNVVRLSVVAHQPVNRWEGVRKTTSSVAWGKHGPGLTPNLALASSRSRSKKINPTISPDGGTAEQTDAAGGGEKRAGARAAGTRKNFPSIGIRRKLNIF